MKPLRWGIFVTAAILAVAFGGNAVEVGAFELTPHTAITTQLGAFQGYDVTNRRIVSDPTILFVTFGDSDEIADLVIPPDFQPEFETPVDFYFAINAQGQFTIDSRWSSALVNVTTPATGRLLQDTTYQDGGAQTFDPAVSYVAFRRSPTDYLVMSPTFWGNKNLSDLMLQRFTDANIVTPEPGTLALLGLGLIGVVGALRRKAKRGALLGIFLLVGIIGSMSWLPSSVQAQLIDPGLDPVTVTVTNIGNGTVISNPAGIDCGADCSETYVADMVITLTATPDAGFVFGGWSGCDSATDNLCTVTMTADVTVTATFAPAQGVFDCNAVTEIPAAECQELVNFYNSADGANWTNKTGWNQTNTPCSWFGITCGAGHVSRIDLPSNGLSGTIPDFHLPNLTELRLYSNRLSGTIPDFSNLPNLTHLDLSYNQLSGSLPDFSHLPNLMRLYLFWNQLSGTLHDFSHMPNLTELILNNNQLSGSLPDFSNLPHLTWLYLFGNRLSGTIPDFSHMPNLTHLDLSDNQLSGSLPDFSNLPHLTWLRLDMNQLSGSLLDFSNLPNLTTLSLNSIQLSGSLLDFSNLPNLEGLYLGDNKLSGSIPDFSRLPKLTSLHLSWNQLSGSIPDFSNLPNLTQLGLYSNQLSGSIPDFSNLPNLKELNLSSNQLRGSLLDFSNLPNLTELSLSSNQLIGNIPDFSHLSNLTGLYLTNNKLSGSIPDLSHLLKLTTLSLSSNQLIGNIPDFSHLSNLTGLYLMNNQLSGSIPDLSHLLKLTALYLHANRLSGQIPNSDWSRFQPLSLNFQPLTLNKNCGLVAFDAAQAAVLSSKDPDWQVLNPLCGTPISHTLDVINAGNGTVASTPAGIDCGADCTERYALDTPVTLTATPDAGFMFAGWSGCDSATDNQCTVTLTAAKAVTATFAPAPSTVRALILTNRQQFAELYGDSEATQVMNRLNALAASSDVQGVVVDLNSDPTVAAAYAARGADYENKEKANVVANAIYDAVLKSWKEQKAYPDLEYLVIVGDDRVVPFYRLRDILEPRDKDGNLLPPDVWTLTDDFYADHKPISMNDDNCFDCVNNENPDQTVPYLFMPDLASGRLVESPSQIIGQIDTFLSGQRIDLRQAAVSGYDAFSDGAAYQCATLMDDQIAANCSLIGNSWTKNALASLALTTRNDLVSLNLHANPREFGTPDGGVVSDSEIVAAATDFSRAIWYSIGCHAGKNLAESLDLPESFSIKQATYAANTGYGWGKRFSVGYSEALMALFTQHLTAGTETTVGKALIAAKSQYYSKQDFMNATHVKILTESTLYGLPMYQVASPAGTPAPPADPMTVATQAVALANGLSKETRAYSWALPTPTVTSNGTYYSLNGDVTDEDGKPVLPVLIDDLGTMADRVKGVVFLGGAYSIVNAAPPLQRVVTTQMTPAPPSGTQTFAAPNWYPAMFGGFNSFEAFDGRRQTLIATAGQSNPNLAANQQRIFTAMNFEVYAHANSTDFTAPTIASVTSALQGSAATITAQADDPSGIETVVVAYTDGKGAWRSVTLTQSGATWTGSIPAAGPTEFFVQAVDKAGNVAVDERDGAYYVLPFFTVRKAANNTGTGVILLGRERCEADCMEASVPVSPTTTLIIKAVASPDSRFVGWQRLDGTPIAQHNLRAKPGDTIIAVFERKK